MIDVPTIGDSDLVGLSMTGGIAHFPGFATERTMVLSLIDPEHAAALLVAADAAAFFTRTEPGEAPVRPDVRTWLLRLSHAGRSRLLALSEPFSDPPLATLVRLARGCFYAGPSTSNDASQAEAGGDEQKPASVSASILDALDMSEVGDIDIDFDRPVNHPRPATFD